MQLELDGYVPKLRWTRGFCIWLAATGRLVGSVAEKLAYELLVMQFTYGGATAYVHLALVCAVVPASLNLETRASSAIGSYLDVPATCAVGPEQRVARERMWQAMPSATLYGR